MKKTRKLNKFKVGIVVIIIVLLFTIPVFGRYIYNSIREAYFTSRLFYFSSDILTLSGAKYQYNNWSGQDEYQIQFDLYSYESEWAKLDYDLEYTISCSTVNSDKVKCSINEETQTTDDVAGGVVTAEGTIPGSNSELNPKNTSIVTIKVKPKTIIAEGETIKVNVSASTTEPYEKTISCEFSLKPQIGGSISYKIEDEENRDYAILKLTCPGESATVTLEFDPEELRIDSNDEIYVNRDKTAGKTVTDDIAGKDYVKKFSYTMPAETTKYVKFYKVNKALNYTYPSDDEDCAIQVTAEQTS